MMSSSASKTVRGGAGSSLQNSKVWAAFYGEDSLTAVHGGVMNIGYQQSSARLLGRYVWRSSSKPCATSIREGLSSSLCYLYSWTFLRMVHATRFAQLWRVTFEKPSPETPCSLSLLCPSTLLPRAELPLLSQIALGVSDYVFDQVGER